MPWIIGIDEAGYGPNLGPFVMTSVACRVPSELAGADLWRVLKRAVRRHTSPDDGRLVIEDSKLIYSPTRGLLALEIGVLAMLSCGSAGTCEPGRTNGVAFWLSASQPLAPSSSLCKFLEWLSPGSHTELSREPWYTGTSGLPVEARPDDLFTAAARLEKACAKKQIHWG